MKNLKKKILYSALSLIFFSFLVSPSFSFAAATLTVTGQTENSVTLKVDGLTVGQSYHINVLNSSSVVKSYWDLNAVTNSVVTTTSPSTLPLSFGTYTAKISDQSPAVIAISTPFTISGSGQESSSVIITAPTIESRKAILKIVGLVPGGNYTLAVNDNSSTTPVYNKHVDFTGATNPSDVVISDLEPTGSYKVFVSEVDGSSNLQYPIANFSFVTPDETVKITASVSEITTTSAKITVNIDEVNPYLFPIKLGLAWGRAGEAVQIHSLNTQNLTYADIPYIIDTVVSLEPNSLYSYRVVQTGTNFPYTGIQNFSTLEQWSYKDANGEMSDPYDTKEDCDASRSGYIEAGFQPQSECLSYVPEVPVDHSCPTGQTWDDVINACVLGTIDTTNGDTTNQDLSSPASKLIPECPKSGCGFKELMQLISNFVRFVLYYLAVPIAALMFVYAGFQMVTSGGSAEKATQARHIFTNAVIGLALAAGSWLIISSILSILGYEGSWIGF